MRWYRQLVARKSDYSDRRGPGRPRIMEEITALIVRMALEIRRGAIRGFKAHSPIWVMQSGAARSPISSKRTALIPRLNEANARAGRHFSKPIGNAFRQPTSL